MGYVAKKGAAPSRSAKTARPASKGTIEVTSEHRPHQKEVMHRLRRVEGQIRGVLAMMEQDKPCDAIAQQLSAARKALDRAFYEMMACSLEMEVSGASNDTALCERIAEKTRLMAKYA
ncbi:MAG: metal-sensitive transcriptional regulator [Panacagrimonas sp.]